MRLRLILLLTLLVSFASLMNGQDVNDNTLSDLFRIKKERYFRFRIHDKHETAALTKIVSIDQVRGDSVWAYANRRQFGEFLKTGYEFTLLPNPGDLIKPKMVDHVNLKDRTTWDFYPTYSAYLNLMSQFQSNYPTLCKIDTIGVTINGRLILAAKVSANVTADEAEPEFFYTSSIHGDETTGYILMMHLIDHLLLNYGSDTRITGMLNSTEIWINPLSNPDGTYAGGNNTVSGATRGNANGVDMNRNYPDPQDGPHPDGEQWQPETQAFMAFAGLRHFVMSANFHGGAEVFNYPWDTWPRLHPDDNWWFYVGRQYADTVHAHSGGGYMTDQNNGITNGYAWYEVDGGRQDYMNYFWNCREVTIELSNIKLLPASQLIPHWNYNYRSLLNYIDQSRYGIRGTVTDSLTGNPVHAKVFILNHDADSSHVYSSAGLGDYYRPVKAGTYTLVFSAPCYFNRTITNISVTDLHSVTQDVLLRPMSGLNPNFTADRVNITFGDHVQFSDLSCGGPVTWQWSFEGGTPATSAEQNPNVVYSTAGIFDVSLTISDGVNSQTLVRSNYITVAQNILMANGTVTTCTGNFYDSGGPGNDYSNNENKVMTLVPGTSGAMLKVTFSQFETETNYDYLYIYNGNSVNAPQIAGSPFNGSTGPGTVTATNASGALTFKFTSDGSVTKVGWAAVVQCEGGTTGYTISGVVAYPNTGNTPLTGISVSLKNGSGTVIASTTTNASGNYAFPGVNNGTYSLQPSTTKPWGSVTALDVLLFKKHIANISHLTGIYLACGDVNGSGSLTASDVLLIKKRIATIINAFPVGDWLFNNQPVTVNGNDITANFNGILYGDANASYSGTFEKPVSLINDINPLKSGSTASITIKPAVRYQNMVTYSLAAAEITNLGAFQFSIRYNPETLIFKGVSDWYPGIGEVVTGNPEPGRLTFVWVADMHGIDIAGGALCDLTFDLVSDNDQAIFWSDEPTPCELSDFDAHLLNVALLNESAGSQGAAGLSTSTVFGIYPNPGSGEFTIRLNDTDHTDSKVSVYNALGLMVYTADFPSSGTQGSMHLDLTQLPGGIYFVKVNNGNETGTQKIVIRRP